MAEYKFIRVDTGPVIVTLPFETIGSIRFNHPDAASTGAIITLGDGSVVEGRTWGSFQGQTDLGKRIDEREWASLAFAHKPEATSVFIPHGKHSAVVHAVDGGQIVLAGATFLRDRFGKEGCYVGDAYVDTFYFKSGGAEYEVGWNKVAAIARVSADSKTALTLVLRDGKTRKVLLEDTSADAVIEGVASHVGRYRLQTLVPLNRSSFANVEFRD